MNFYRPNECIENIYSIYACTIIINSVMYNRCIKSMHTYFHQESRKIKRSRCRRFGIFKTLSNLYYTVLVILQNTLSQLLCMCVIIIYCWNFKYCDKKNTILTPYVIIDK